MYVPVAITTVAAVRYLAQKYLQATILAGINPAAKRTCHALFGARELPGTSFSAACCATIPAL